MDGLQFKMNTLKLPLLHRCLAIWRGDEYILSISLIGFSSSRRITPNNIIYNELLVINLAAVTG
jgi:hypothetical protein